MDLGYQKGSQLHVERDCFWALFKGGRIAILYNINWESRLKTSTTVGRLIILLIADVPTHRTLNIKEKKKKKEADQTQTTPND